MDSSFFVDSERPKTCFELIRRFLINSERDVKGTVVYTGLCQNLAMFFRLPKFVGLEKDFSDFCLSKFRPLFAKSGACADCLGDAYESPSQFVNLLLRRCYPPDVAKFLSKRGYRLVALDFIHFMESEGRFTDFVFPYSFFVVVRLLGRCTLYDFRRLTVVRRVLRSNAPYVRGVCPRDCKHMRRADTGNPFCSLGYRLNTSILGYPGSFDCCPNLEIKYPSFNF